MTKLYPPDHHGNSSPFVKVRVIGDYNSLYHKCVQLKQTIEKLDITKKRNRELGERLKINKRRWCCCGKQVDAYDHYVKSIDDMKHEIRVEKQM